MAKKRAQEQRKSHHTIIWSSSVFGFMIAVMVGGYGVKRWLDQIPNRSPRVSKPLAYYTQAELLKLEEKHTVESIKETFEGWIKPMLERAGNSDPIPEIRSSIDQLARLIKQGSYRVEMSGQFCRDPNGRIVPWVLAKSKPGFYDQNDKLLQAGLITIYLPAFEEYLPFPDRFGDVLLSTLSHEYYHLKYDTPRFDAQGFIEGEALVWGKQVEGILVPMEQTGRFLRPVQLEAIRAYQQFKDDPDKWRAWIASKHRTRLAHLH